MKRTLLLAMAALSLLLGACVNHNPAAVMHQRMNAEQATFPTKLVLLPLDVSVSQVTASGNVDEDPVWCEQARKSLSQAVQRELAARPSFVINPLPKLNETEQARLDEHLALFDLVAGNAITAVNNQSPAWNYKRQKFDYSIGPGLADFREKAGADVALIIIANDFISTGGRKAMSVAATMLGVAPAMGYAGIYAGIVDLQTGDILWLDYFVSYAEKSLLKEADVDEMVKALFQDLPAAQGINHAQKD